MWWLALLAFVLSLGVCSSPFGATAQGTRKIPRVGIIGPAVRGANFDAFRSGLRELGYIEGQSILIEDHWAEGKPERFADLIADLLKSNVDVLVVAGAAGARAAKSAAPTTPVVFVAVTDALGSGIVESLARPGGNITGMSMAVGEGFAGKWVELVKDALPRVSGVAALVETTHPMKGHWVNEMGTAARALGLKLQPFDTRDLAELEGALSTIAKTRVGALIITPSPLLNSHRKRIADFARQRRLPTMGCYREQVVDGMLMSYGPSLTDSFRRGAAYVDRILKGARPGDLPVEQPTKYEFALNQRTAKALGLTIPPSILIRADEVIE
jgi:putative ABC transport system substrate-binding protein